MQAVDYAGLRKEQAEQRDKVRARREPFSHGYRCQLSSPRSSAPGQAATVTSWASAMFDSCEIRVHPTGSAIARLGTKSPGPGARNHLCSDPGDRDRDSLRGYRHRGGRYRYGALRSGHLRLALDAGCRCGRRTGGPEDPRQGAEDRGLTCWRSPRTTWSGRSTASRSRVCPKKRRP